MEQTDLMESQEKATKLDQNSRCVTKQEVEEQPQGGSAFIEQNLLPPGEGAASFFRPPTRPISAAPNAEASIGHSRGEPESTM